MAARNLVRADDPIHLYKSRWRGYGYHMFDHLGRPASAWEHLAPLPISTLAEMAMDSYCDGAEEDEPDYAYMIDELVDHFRFPDTRLRPASRQDATTMLTAAGKEWLIEFVYAGQFARREIPPALTPDGEYSLAPMTIVLGHAAAYHPGARIRRAASL